MDSAQASPDSTDGSRAIRQALMWLEQAWNAQEDTALLNRLFTAAPTVIDVQHEEDGEGMFLLPGEPTGVPTYCAISVQQIVRLAEALVYAAFSVQIRRDTQESLSNSNRTCTAVLERDDSGEWKIRLLHFV